MSEDVLIQIKNHLYNMPFAMDKKYMKMAIEEIEKLREELKVAHSRRERYYDATSYNNYSRVYSNTVVGDMI